MTTEPTRTFGAYPAYQMDVREEGLGFDFITYCNRCAYRLSSLPFTLGFGSLPDSMEDVIAAMVLKAVETDGITTLVPYGLSNPEGNCDECETPLSEVKA
jgi:hypothetical protein